MSSLRPPAYVNTPVAVVYAEGVDDALLVTMTRLLGLCWQHDYRRTPALTPDQLAELTGRSRSALYRHLDALEALGWLRIERAGRKLILRPLVTQDLTGQPPGCGRSPDRTTAGPVSQTPAGGNAELLAALADAGIEEPARSRLARQGVDPAWVRGWQRWAGHPHRRGLTNPAGLIIRKLEAGAPPPARFLHPPEPDNPAAPEAGEACTEQREREQPGGELWAAALAELQGQMTRATFDAWLRGSRAVGADEAGLIVAVRNQAAADWLQHRLLAPVRRTLERLAGAPLAVEFVVES